MKLQCTAQGSEKGPSQLHDNKGVYLHRLLQEILYPQESISARLLYSDVDGVFMDCWHA